MIIDNNCINTHNCVMNKSNLIKVTLVTGVIIIPLIKFYQKNKNNKKIKNKIYQQQYVYCQKHLSTIIAKEVHLIMQKNIDIVMMDPTILEKKHKIKQLIKEEVELLLKKKSKLINSPSNEHLTAWNDIVNDNEKYSEIFHRVIDSMFNSYWLTYLTYHKDV